MTVRRLSTVLIALTLGLLSAYAVACGQDETGLLSPGRAEGLQNNLDDLERAVDRGDCDVAASQIEDIRRQIAALPEQTDSGLRDRLQEGVENLETVAATECAADDQPTQTDTAPTEPTPTEPVPTEPTPTEPTPTEPTPTEPTPTPTTPTPTEPTPTPTPAPTTPTPAPGPESPPGGEEAPSGAAGDEQ